MATVNDWWQCRCGEPCARNVLKCPACGYDPRSREAVPPEGCDNERELHDCIISYCLAHQWPYIHSRMDLPTTTQKGIADFVILAPGGKTLIIEAKTKKGKQRPEQIGWQMLCERVGHTYHLVRNYEQFKAIADQCL